MALVTIFLALFFFLGLFFGPLLLAVSTKAFSPERGKAIGRWALRLGFKSIYRPAITFNAADELALKRRSYDEKHNAEYIKFGGLGSSVKRYLHDPQDRIHSFYGIPFGLVDEIFGVVVDPRDIAIGRALRDEQSNGQYTHRVEQGERLHEAVKAVFEMPRGHVGTRLSDVDTLVGGSFDSQVVDRIREIYQKSQAPRTSAAPWMKLLLPLGAFVGVVLLGTFVASQGVANSGSAPSPPSGNSSTINVGSTLLFMLISLSDWRAINHRDIFVGGVYALLGLGFAAMMTVAMPTPYPLLGIPLPLGLWAIVMLAIGLGTIPFFAFWFGRSLGGLGVGLGKLFTVIAFLAYERPVIDFDNGEYVIREYSECDWASEPKWYRFAFTRIGVSFDNDESNWPNGTTIKQSKVEEMVDSANGDLPAPAGYTATPLIAVKDIVGYLPDEPEDDSVFVRTDRTTGWLLEAGKARRLMVAALQTAKEEFGGGRAPVSDRWIMAGVFGGMVAGMIFNMVVLF